MIRLTVRQQIAELLRTGATAQVLPLIQTALRCTANFVDYLKGINSDQNYYIPVNNTLAKLRWENVS